MIGVANQNQIFLPQEYPDYSSHSYWENRYKQEISETALGTEWYLSPEDLFAQVLQARMFNDHETEILIAGAGSSSLGAYLYKMGFHYITNVDFSQVIVDYMTEKNRALDEMEYSQLDLCQ